MEFFSSPENLLSCPFFLFLKIWRYFNGCFERSPRGLNWRFAATTVFLILLQPKGQRLYRGLLEPERTADLEKHERRSWFQHLPTRRRLYLSSDQCCDCAPLNFFVFRWPFFADLPGWICDLQRAPTCTAGLLAEGGGASNCLLVHFVYYWIKMHRYKCPTSESFSTSHQLPVHMSSRTFQREPAQNAAQLFSSSVSGKMRWQLFPTALSSQRLLLIWETLPSIFSTR